MYDRKCSLVIRTITARIISSFYNYMVNRNLVFAGNKGRNTLIKYYALAVVVMVSSGFLTTLLHSLLLFHEVGAKVLVDTVLFLMSYSVQKKWVF